MTAKETNDPSNGKKMWPWKRNLIKDVSGYILNGPLGMAGQLLAENISIDSPKHDRLVTIRYNLRHAEDAYKENPTKKNRKVLVGMIACLLKFARTLAQTDMKEEAIKKFE